MSSASAKLSPRFWWLFVGNFVMALGTFVFPFLALFLRERGFSTAQAGLIVSLFGAGSIPAGLLAGHFADRLGRRPTLLVSLLAAAAMTALLPLLRIPMVLAVGTLALGVAMHAYFPAANAMVADVVPESRHADAFGRLYWVRNIGIASSFVIGGALAGRGYERLFWADAATTLLFAGIVAFRLPETHRPEGGRPADSWSAAGFREALADHRLMRLLALNVGFLVALFQFMAAVPVAMASKGLTTQHYGQVMAVNGALIALLQPAITRFAGRFAPAHVLAAAAGFVGVGYGTYALCETAPAFAVATAVWSVGEIAAMPVVSALVAGLAPPHLRGRYQGLLGLSFGLALTLAPALGGAVLDGLGPTALWGSVAALAALVATGHLAAGRRWPAPPSRVA